MPTEHFDSIKLGDLGTVTNPEKGKVFEGEYKVTGKKVKPTNPPSEVLSLESVRRRIQWIPGNVGEGRPEEFRPTDDPFSVCHELPASWFLPSAPAPAPAPAKAPAAK
jgi:hypothetical protein